MLFGELNSTIKVNEESVKDSLLRVLLLHLSLFWFDDFYISVNFNQPEIVPKQTIFSKKCTSLRSVLRKCPELVPADLNYIDPNNITRSINNI